MAKKTKAPITLAKSAGLLPKSLAKPAQPAPKAAAAKESAKSASPAAPAQAKVKAASAPVQAAPKQAPVKQTAQDLSAVIQPAAILETLAKRRQENLNEAIAQLHALHSQMLHAAGRHANTALQFLNSAPKTGTLTDMIDWQSRWLLSHAHVHQDGIKALGSLASKNIEQLQKSLRVDLPKIAS
jgi:hypothetical protein